MKFTICTTDTYNTERVLKDYPILEEFNFEADPNGKYAYITVNTIEELIDLMNRCEHPLIVGRPFWKDSPLNEIEIYDNYRE